MRHRRPTVSSLYVFYKIVSYKQVHGYFTLAPLQQLSAVFPFSHFNYNVQEVSRNTPLLLDSTPIDTGTPSWCFGTASSILLLNTDSCQWAWLGWGYCHYRNYLDWVIDTNSPSNEKLLPETFLTTGGGYLHRKGSIPPHKGLDTLWILIYSNQTTSLFTFLFLFR